MQDKQVSSQKDNQQTLPPRSPRLLEHLERLWQQVQEPDAETIKHLITTLPEPYNRMLLETLAEHLVHTMKLHFLDIVATFYQKAEQENIDAEERNETLQEITAIVEHLMNQSKRLSIHSLDQLVTLGNITTGLNTLSKVDDADSAQNWMYKLPALYQSRMEQERLIDRDATWSALLTVNVTVHYTTQRATPVVKTRASQKELLSNWRRSLVNSNFPYSHINTITSEPVS